MLGVVLVVMLARQITSISSCRRQGPGVMVHRPCAAGRGRNSVPQRTKARGRSTISAMRANRLCGVIGLARNSVTPASRAASTRCFSVWPGDHDDRHEGIGAVRGDCRISRVKSMPVHRLHRQIGQNQVAWLFAQQRPARRRRCRLPESRECRWNSAAFAAANAYADCPRQSAPAAPRRPTPTSAFSPRLYANSGTRPRPPIWPQSREMDATCRNCYRRLRKSGYQYLYEFTVKR